MPVHQGAKSTGVLSAGENQVETSATPCILHGYNLMAGTAASSVTFADGNGGTVLWQDSIVAASAAGDDRHAIMFTVPVVFTNSLYITVTGTAATCVAIYTPLK